MFSSAAAVLAKPVDPTPAPAATTDTTGQTNSTDSTQQNTAVPQTAADARLQEVQKAAQAVAEMNYYPVSSVRFTIYKDIAGNYVTRYTSLKDGKVTYYPQKSLQELMKQRAAENAAIFHTEV